jgi:V-type H+-transporting ATPase subunit a
MPPTYFKINAFTYPFQEIVNTYGIPTYKEINPAYFACITFPFLFGIMFGDFGHGMIFLIFGTVICLFNSLLYRIVPSIRLALKIRYLILLMGFFATYCGLIYNDFMSIPMGFFKSCYYR